MGHKENSNQKNFNRELIRKRNILYLISLASLVLLALLACNRRQASAGAKQNEAQSAPSTEKLVFALDWTPNTNHTGLYVAQKRGYFREAGLEVEIRMPQTSVTQLIASGRIPFGIGFQEFGTSSMANEDIPIISVAAVLQHNTSGFTSMTDRNILRPRDFGGKLFASWGNPFEISLVKHLIAADGGDPNDFDSVNIGEASLAGLLQNKVDYVNTFYAWENIGFDLQGLETNFIPIKDLDPVFDYYTPIIIANLSYIKQNQDISQRFIQTVARGYEYAAQNPDQAAEILLEYAPELERELVMRSQRYLSRYYLDENGEWGLQNPEVWDRLSQWMFDNQLIDKIVPTDKAMTNELLRPQAQ